MFLTSYEQLDKDWLDWESMTPKDGYIRRGYQRFGQYVWNKYEWPDRASWPELFYEINSAQAYLILLDYIHHKD